MAQDLGALALAVACGLLGLGERVAVGSSTSAPPGGALVSPAAAQMVRGERIEVPPQARR